MSADLIDPTAPGSPLSEPAIGATKTRSRDTGARETVAALVRSKSVVVGATIVLVWVICAIFGSVLAPADPLATHPLEAFLSPSAGHLFGTDNLGRDVFSRVVVGARDVITVALLATILATALGVALGLVMGYLRGLADDTLSRVLEAFLAVPSVIMALLALAALGTSRWAVIAVIGLIAAPAIARTVRAAVLAEQGLEYVEAAKVRGEGAGYIMFAEILPNVIPPIVVEFTVRLGYSVFAVATLSFLGFGIQPPSPDWGLQISDSYSLIAGGYWWTALFPAMAIASLVVGVNLLADGIQAVLER